MQPLSVLKIFLLYSIKQIQEPYKSITSKKCNEIFRGRQQNKATITRQLQKKMRLPATVHNLKTGII